MEQAERLARLEEHVHNLEASMKTLHQAHAEALSEMNKRVHDLERTIWKACGALSTVWAIVQFASQFIKHP